MEMYLSALVVASVILAALSYGLLRVYVSRRMAAAVASVKFGIPLVYFAALFDPLVVAETSVVTHPTLTIGDDVRYHAIGVALREQGLTPVAPLLGETGLQQFVSGRHVFYYWWDVFAKLLFGPHYYAAVLLNVFLSVLVGIYLVKLLYFAGFSRNYSRWFLPFFLLHWDVLAWTSFVNIKGTTVMLMTVGSIYHFLRAYYTGHRQLRWTGLHLGITGLYLVALLFNRYYVVVVLICAIGLWYLSNGEYSVGQLGLFSVVILGGLVILLQVLSVRALVTTPLQRLHPLQLLWGLARFALTPVPWQVDSNYLFLFVPAVLHWLTLPLSVVGTVRMWLENEDLRLPLVYVAIISVMFAMTTYFNGSRQRYQLVFVTALVQYHALRYFLSAVRIESPLSSGLSPSKDA